MSVKLLRPAQHAHAFKGRSIVGGPVFQKVVQNGVKMLLGRVPGLQQVVIELHFVEGADGGFGVGVGGEQHPFGFRVNFHRLG